MELPPLSPGIQDSVMDVVVVLVTVRRGWSGGTEYMHSWETAHSAPVTCLYSLFYPAYLAPAGSALFHQCPSYCWQHTCSTQNPQLSQSWWRSCRFRGCCVFRRWWLGPGFRWKDTQVWHFWACSRYEVGHLSEQKRTRFNKWNLSLMSPSC